MDIKLPFSADFTCHEESVLSQDASAQQLQKHKCLTRLGAIIAQYV